MHIHSVAQSSRAAAADGGNSEARQTLYALPAPLLDINFFLLRSHPALVSLGEIPRRFFSSPLLASGHFAATLFRPVFGPAAP